MSLRIFDLSPPMSCVTNIQMLFAADVERLLIQDGLLGRPVKWSKHGYWYFDLSHGYRWATSGHTLSQSLWMSLFIPADVWLTAVDRFQRDRTLVENLYHSLLPALPDPDATFRYVYADRPLLCSFIDRNLLGAPVRVTKKSVYYFDDTGIYRKRSRTVAEQAEPPVLWHLQYVEDINTFSWVRAARSAFHPGMSLDACLEAFLQTVSGNTDGPIPYTDLDQLVQRISPPSFERIPENQNPNTFDRIRVQVCLSTYLCPSYKELAAILRKHRTALDEIVLHLLSTNPAFLRFHVPVNFLRLSACTLRQDRVLEYLFELKE